MRTVTCRLVLVKFVISRVYHLETFFHVLFKPHKTGETSACVLGRCRGCGSRLVSLRNILTRDLAYTPRREENHGMSCMPCSGMQHQKLWIRQSCTHAHKKYQSRGRERCVYLPDIHVSTEGKIAHHTHPELFSRRSRSIISNARPSGLCVMQEVTGSIFGTS